MTIGLAALSLLIGAVAPADARTPAEGGPCSATTQALFKACQFGVQDDYWVAFGTCTNVVDAAERAKCLAEARAARDEANILCRDQRESRDDVCDRLGEDRYAPDFEPAFFITSFTNPAVLNAYLPLRVGNKWTYRSQTEQVAVEVLNRTKLIAGVRCVVVRDVVSVKGRPVEDTFDWFAQALNGDAYVCGEEVKDYETFAGDQPPLPELVAIDGSFKAGRDGDKPGIAFRGAPREGELYRQEYSLANAEDLAAVISTDYAFGHDPVLDHLVPRDLAEFLCPGHCVVTREFTPVEPDAFEYKYYAPGVGQFLATNPGKGTVSRLVSCNTDPRCSSLP